MSNQTTIPADRADQLAAELAADVAAGRRDETAARWSIVSRADEAGVIDSVVRRFHSPGQFAKDVADELGRLGAVSALGWARQMLTAAHPNALRTL